jgi:hypothetical protein
MTKCEFLTFGTGGHMTSEEYLCVLAPNVISEKIFTFLWFWYILLAVITFVNIILVISMAAKSSRIRMFYLTRLAWTRKVGENMLTDYLYFLCFQHF